MTTTDLHFRTATPDDAPQIRALVESAFRAEDSRPNWTADMRLGVSFRFAVEQVLPQITKPEGAILLAADGAGAGGALVASVEVCRRADGVGRISMLAVDRRHQQGGLGRRVLAYAEEYCRRTWGVERTGLNALNTRRELIAWYVRRGYRETGEVSPFPREVAREFGMEEELWFVELEKVLDGVVEDGDT